MVYGAFHINWLHIPSLLLVENVQDCYLSELIFTSCKRLHKIRKVIVKKMKDIKRLG